MSKLVEKFNPIKAFAKKKEYDISIDNFIAKLHYKFTTVALLICTILVTYQELIGEHIRCISDKGVPENVLNTFCFFSTTFTVVRNSSNLDKFVKIHPGVGNYNSDTDQLTNHAYYQWVPFVLVIQTLLFAAPHSLWKYLEGGEMKNIVTHLGYAQYSFMEKDIKINAKNIPSINRRNELFEQLSKLVQRDRVTINRRRCRNFIFCEILYALNLVFQTYCINAFLGGQFLSLGKHIITDGIEDISVFDKVFPKMTKCNFHKYGPSGTVQTFDALCVMALNIIHEKIYTFLWFWFVILFILTILVYIWRLLSYICHKNVFFNKIVFGINSPGKLNVKNIVKKFSYSDWLYLVYLSKNLDKMVFRKFIEYLNDRTNYYRSTSSEKDLMM